MKSFGTFGPVFPDKNYVVSRCDELRDFINRVKQGRYIVLFAPRQTGKTTFFKNAITTLNAHETEYLPIQLNFEKFVESNANRFYDTLGKDLCREINSAIMDQDELPKDQISIFLNSVSITDPISMVDFFYDFGKLIKSIRLVIIFDEFDGIPPDALRGFLHALRHIYLSNSEHRCPHSVGIVGVKNITQLNYDRSISPFNIQDEFKLSNFTLEQVQELFAQYTDEVRQEIDTSVIGAIHKHSAGQPFLVNRFGQILTEELNLPTSEIIQMDHFNVAYKQLLNESNTNISHLTGNIRKDPRLEKFLMGIALNGENRRFNLDNEIISELATYGIIAEDENGLCAVHNPIYLQHVIQLFQPLINGLEDQYFTEDGPHDFREFVTAGGQLQMHSLIDNFSNFITRAGFRILQVPETPQEFVGQYLLFGYLDEYVNLIGATMFLEIPTGRGRADLIVVHKRRKYIIETKIWRSEKSYQLGKKQLAAYMKNEKAQEGYYIVFDYREKSISKVEIDTVDGLVIHSYAIPVLQERPSQRS